MPDLSSITRSLSRAISSLDFAEPVTHIYNPLQYARRSHEQYLERFGQGPKEVLFMGMNPGPFGMAQTGVPFGEIEAVRSWMGIEEPVKKPKLEHPKRPIEGFACQRSEVSGRRLWGWAQQRYGKAEHFFSRFYVHNYCPLVFMGESGKNITPDKLPAAEREPLYKACDRSLQKVVELLSPKILVGIGAFAEQRAKFALRDLEFDLRILKIPHPSPASPVANRGWAEATEKALQKQNFPKDLLN